MADTFFGECHYCKTETDCIIDGDGKRSCEECLNTADIEIFERLAEEFRKQFGFYPTGKDEGTNPTDPNRIRFALWLYWQRTRTAVNAHAGLVECKNTLMKIRTTILNDKCYYKSYNKNNRGSSDRLAVLDRWKTTFLKSIESALAQAGEVEHE